MAKENSIGVPATVDIGGTGVTSTTAYTVQCGGTTSTNPLQSIASVGTSGQILTSNGAAALPTFQAASGGSMSFISSTTASSDATVNFENLDSTYFTYLVFLTNVVPATDAAVLRSRVGTGVTPTYQSGASDYFWNYQYTGLSANDTSDTQVNLSRAIGSDTNEYGISGLVWVFNPASASTYKFYNWNVSYVDNSGRLTNLVGAGSYLADTAVTAIQFLYSSGNIESGIFDLYGIKDS